ncbi:hypothetical protein H7J77_04540 [Mycolicibacillus parakoreensis]|uniref:Uncharacterized protein n=1 Tax=Mycolicibacillus parakoreensis TaxID=1069221 RepID=A0ABY3U3G5_9MYCO|nr:hypothetical protein [Mycolicibacillus parakoreensis]MCV7314806.1 hypothetical protein [Mycolicibacillus parakoreensis]ULN54499.1 hypothetical protein MIU77_05770 [Mycolicibacillus parakoreensis]
MAEIHLYFVGIPLGLTLLLALWIWSHKGAHAPTYRMSEPWTHPPVLWAATDEAVGAPAHGHDTAEFSVGGGASGKW